MPLLPFSHGTHNPYRQPPHHPVRHAGSRPHVRNEDRARTAPDRRRLFLTGANMGIEYACSWNEYASYDQSTKNNLPQLAGPGNNPPCPGPRPSLLDKMKTARGRPLTGGGCFSRAQIWGSNMLVAGTNTPATTNPPKTTSRSSPAPETTPPALALGRPCWTKRKGAAGEGFALCPRRPWHALSVPAFFGKVSAWRG